MRDRIIRNRLINEKLGKEVLKEITLKGYVLAILNGLYFVVNHLVKENVTNEIAENVVRWIGYGFILAWVMLALSIIVVLLSNIFKVNEYYKDVYRKIPIKLWEDEEWVRFSKALNHSRLILNMSKDKYLSEGRGKVLEEYYDTLVKDLPDTIFDGLDEEDVKRLSEEWKPKLMESPLREKIMGLQFLDDIVDQISFSRLEEGDLEVYFEPLYDFIKYVNKDRETELRLKRVRLEHAERIKRIWERKRLEDIQEKEDAQQEQNRQETRVEEEQNRETLYGESRTVRVSLNSLDEIQEIEYDRAN